MQPNDPTDRNPSDMTQMLEVADATEEAAPESNAVAWEASEHLQHNNGTGWYIAFFIVALVLIGFAIFYQAWTFIPVVLVMVVAGIIYVRRPPRTLHYALTSKGIAIENIVHSYQSFKSFSVVRDGAFFAILLIPVRRFASSTIIYFDEADGEIIVDVLGAYLPMETRALDPLERFLRFIRF